MTNSITYEPFPDDPLPVEPEFIARHNNGALYLKLAPDNSCLGYEVWLGEAELHFPADGFQAAWSQFVSDAKRCA